MYSTIFLRVAASGIGPTPPCMLSCIMRFPDDRVTVVVLCNVQTVNSSRIAQRLAAIALDG